MRKISEEQITTADTKAVFNAAAELRSKPSGFGKIFKGLRKDKIEVSDLQQAWKEHKPNPYPDDTEDITVILQDHGFSDSEIKKVYADVFDADDEGDNFDPIASDRIQKLANYAIENGIKDELIQFLEKNYEFKESILYDGKLVVEDIRKIFIEMAGRERANRAELLKNLDRNTLGRTKK